MYIEFPDWDVSVPLSVDSEVITSNHVAVIRGKTEYQGYHG
jgi:hypothetical protein